MKRRPKTGVREIPCPSQSAISDWLADADLADAFAVDLTEEEARRGIQGLAESALGHPPPWFRALLSIRDVLVRPFGIKSSEKLRQEAIAKGRDHIDFFPVVSRSAQEIVLGEDDRHLDFRASLRLQRTPGGTVEFVATTVVRCHNRLGKAYLFAITPFHRHVIRSTLAAAAARGWR